MQGERRGVWCRVTGEAWGARPEGQVCEDRYEYHMCDYRMSPHLKTAHQFVLLVLITMWVRKALLERHRRRISSSYTFVP